MPHHVSFEMSEQEWQRIIVALRETWPNERVSNAELLRRCVILGIRTLRYLTPDSARMFVQIYRSYEPPIDGHAPLTTPDEAEGDPLPR